MKHIARASDKSESSLLGMVIIDEFKNVSNIEIKIHDENGVVVFSENNTFNMKNMDINHLTKDTSSSDDSSDEKEDYFNSAEYKRIEKDYWNSI